MRIFSNFDTTLRRKTCETYKESYGPENVICFGKSKLYLIYHIIIPFLLLMAFSAFLSVFFRGRLGGDYFAYVIAILIIMDFIVLLPLLGKYIDYTMDFVVVMPSCVILYDQSGFFGKDVVTINAQSVKSISIEKS